MILILDYGVGNLSAIKNMCNRLGIKSVISTKAEDLQNSDKIILPGVGSFDYGMEQLNNHDVINILNFKVITQKTPILGICLGVQLFTEGSDEGNAPGLGWVKGKTIQFNRAKLLNTQRLPNMGWLNTFNYSNSRLFTDMYPNPRFYFVHSYHLELNNREDVLVEANYGYDFAAGIEHENILGVQFHPEKSHKYGMKIIENFSKYY